MSADKELRIVFHPQRMSGRPTIGDSRLPAADMASYVAAGDSVASVAADFDITPEQVRLACWWLVEHDYGRTRWKTQARKAWAEWADQWHKHIWAMGRYGDPHPGDPPPIRAE